MEWLKGIFSVLGSLINVYKFFKKAPADQTVILDSNSEHSSELVIVSERFTQLFEAHGIKRSQIPRFFGHDLTLAKLKSNEELLQHLTDEILTDACELFAIRRQWLDGESNQIYDIHDFYKRPQEYQQFLDQLLNTDNKYVSKDNVSVWVVRTKQQTRQESDAVLIIEEPIGYLEDRQICRYYLCGNWNYSYWKGRAYLAACVAYSQNHRIYPLGRIATNHWISSVKQGKTFISYDSHYGGAEIPSLERWEVGDILLLPEAFIEDFSESYEFSEGLALWLKLYDEGHLILNEVTLNHGVRDRFQAAYDLFCYS